MARDFLHLLLLEEFRCTSSKYQIFNFYNQRKKTIICNRLFIPRNQPLTLRNEVDKYIFEPIVFSITERISFFAIPLRRYSFATYSSFRSVFSNVISMSDLPVILCYIFESENSPRTVLKTIVFPLTGTPRQTISSFST